MANSGKTFTLKYEQGNQKDGTLETVSLESAPCVNGLRIESLDGLISVKFSPLLNVKGVMRAPLSVHHTSLDTVHDIETNHHPVASKWAAVNI